MGREYEPVPGKWYENLEEDDSFKVLSVDEDAELVEIQYEDGDIEEIDYETWKELDLELTEEPEGWADDDLEEDDEEEEEDEDDWDEDEDEDEDDEDDEDDWDEDDRYGDRDDY